MWFLLNCLKAKRRSARCSALSCWGTALFKKYWDKKLKKKKENIFLYNYSKLSYPRKQTIPWDCEVASVHGTSPTFSKDSLIALLFTLRSHQGCGTPPWSSTTRCQATDWESISKNNKTYLNIFLNERNKPLTSLRKPFFLKINK